MKKLNKTILQLCEASDLNKVLQKLKKSAIIGFHQNFSLSEFNQRKILSHDVEIEFISLSKKQTGSDIVDMGHEMMGEDTGCTVRAVLMLFERNDPLLETIKGKRIIIPAFCKIRAKDAQPSMVVFDPLLKDLQLWEMDKYIAKSISGKDAVMPVLKKPLD